MKWIDNNPTGFIIIHAILTLLGVFIMLGGFFIYFLPAILEQSVEKLDMFRNVFSVGIIVALVPVFVFLIHLIKSEAQSNNKSEVNNG